MAGEIAQKDQENQATENQKLVSYEEYEMIKKAQAGSDRAYQETKKQLDDLKSQFEELRKSSLSEKERADIELKEREAAIVKKERDVAEASLNVTRLRKMNEKGLPAELERFVVGETEEEITESVDTLLGQIERLAKERRDGKLSSPKAGDKTVKKDINAMLRAEYLRSKGVRT